MVSVCSTTNNVNQLNIKAEWAHCRVEQKSMPVNDLIWRNLPGVWRS